MEAYESFEAIDVAAASYVPADAADVPDAGGDAGDHAEPVDGDTNLVHAVPGVDGGRLRATEYVPPTWDAPAYTERLKESADHVRRMFGRYG